MVISGTDSDTEHLFYIALLPPQGIQGQAIQIQQEFVQHYQSRGALKSPPHVTLYPPFKWLQKDWQRLADCLQKFVQTREAISIALSGFGAFPPRVIYLNVVKTPELLQLQQDLMECLETELSLVDEPAQKRPFSPHMTVAYRDLTQDNFKIAWPKFKQQEFQAEFIVSELTLLILSGQIWQIQSEFMFKLDPK
ncbi:MAG: 2'-5' RNA ligase family protein [Microcoleaceae cyanobacterium]